MPDLAARYLRLFGLDLESTFPFVTRLDEGRGPPDLVFECSSEEGDAPDLDLLTPSYSSPTLNRLGVPVSSLYRRPGSDILRFPGTADFDLRRNRIDCHLIDPERKNLAEIATVRHRARKAK